MAMEIIYRGNGRPTKLTEEVYRYLVDNAGKANYEHILCEAAGIDQATLINYKRHAKEVSEYISNNNIDNPTIDNLPDDLKYKLIYFQLFEDIKRERAKGVVQLHNHVASAVEAGPQYWPAAATLLERIAPADYGKRSGDEELLKSGAQFLQALSEKLRTPKQIE